MAYIIRIFDTSEWELGFDCSPYITYPKKCQVLKLWSADNKADLTMNLAYFNFNDAVSRKANAVHRTLQYLRIAKRGGDCAYGGTEEKITLPNGDKIAGFSLGIKNGVVKENSTSSKRSRNGMGITTDGKYFIAQSTSNVTLKAFCTYINSKLKVALFLCNDGGGSTGCYSARSKILFAPEREGTNGRAVPNVVYAKLKNNPNITKTLSTAIKGYDKDVLMLQMVLGNVECDGLFGSGTKSAVKQAQKNLGLIADGIAGPLTLKALGLRR